MTSSLRLNDAKRRNFNQTTAAVCRGGIYTGRHSVWIRSNKKSANMKLTSFQFHPVAACGTAADREPTAPKKYFLQMDHRDKRCLQKVFFYPSRFYICELFLELRKTVLKSVNRKHSRTYSKGLHNQ